MAPGTPAEPPHADYAARSRATQQRILDAAVAVLVDVGYAGASTVKIQERAGVSRGRLLHHYPQRNSLLVAAVQHLAEARITVMFDATDWPDEPLRRIDAAVDAMWASYQQGFFWAATELWLAARHNQALAAALRPREQALGAAIRSATDAMFGPDLTAREHYPVVRELLMTSMRGVALAYAFDPRDSAGDPHVREWKELAIRVLVPGSAAT